MSETSKYTNGATRPQRERLPTIDDLKTQYRENLQAANKAEVKADDHRLNAALALVELKRRVEAGEAGKLKFWPWFELNFPGQNVETARFLVRVGSAPDPKAFLEAAREASRERMRRYREIEQDDEPEDQQDDEPEVGAQGDVCPANNPETQPEVELPGVTAAVESPAGPVRLAAPNDCSACSCGFKQRLRAHLTAEEWDDLLADMGRSQVETLN